MNLLSPHGRIARLIRKHEQGYQNANVSDGKPRARKGATLPSVDLAKFLTTLHVLWQKIVAILRGNPLPYDEAFKATRRPSIKVLVLHLIPIAAVFVITSLNLYGYWIGKELSGVNNQNAPKELALQLTAKAHELLILASVSEIVLTHLLKSLACGYGLPFGSLTAGSKFKDLSYIWSRDFRAMWTVGYPRKSLLLPLILLCLALSIVAGPSSATALIPRLAEWPSGKAVMTLNTTEDALWPSRLEGGISSSSSSTSCDKSTLGCFNPLTWDSIGSALFSYWGHDTTGGSPALPQHINVPGVSSLRSMDTKLRTSAGSLDPPYTLATVQHAVTGDMVNTFRFLTFPSRSKKCGKRWAGAMCSYQDVKWYAKTMQPLVLTTCMETGLNTTRVAFPSLEPKTFVLTTRYIDLQNVTFGDDERHPQFRWVSSTNQEMSDTSASIDVVVKLPATTFGVRGGFACTIQAQWSKSTTFTSFTGTDNLVSSTVSGMKSSMLDAKQYKSQPVLSIASEWAQRVVDSRLNSQSNDTRTAFESFMQLGEVDANPEGKIEMALSVLFAETMAHTSSGTAPLSISSKDLYLKESGVLSAGQQQNQGLLISTSLTTPDGKQEEPTKFTLSTSMVGYGYGLFTVSGLSWSTMISIVVLYVYALVVLVHLVCLYASRELYIESWREDSEMLLACLWSRDGPAVSMGGSGGQGNLNGSPNGKRQAKNGNEDEESTILKEIVMLTCRRKRAEVSFRTKGIQLIDDPV